MDRFYIAFTSQLATPLTLVLHRPAVAERLRQGLWGPKLFVN
jgi:hypothetical protein